MTATNLQRLQSELLNVLTDVKHNSISPLIILPRQLRQLSLAVLCEILLYQSVDMRKHEKTNKISYARFSNITSYGVSVSEQQLNITMEGFSKCITSCSRQINYFNTGTCVFRLQDFQRTKNLPTTCSTKRE